MKTQKLFVIAVMSCVLCGLLGATATPADARGPSSGDSLLDLLRETDGAQALVAAAETADESGCGILDALAKPSGRVVVLAPTNRAFEEFFDLREGFFDGRSIEEIKAMLNSLEPSEDLCELLRKHVATDQGNPQQSSLDGLVVAGKIPVDDGSVWPISVSSGDVMVNYEAEVGYGDVIRKNGVVHFLKSVIKDEATSAVVEVFLMKTGFPLLGDLSGLEGADALCTAAASAAGLTGGTWTAWLSDDSVDARDRIADGEYRLVNGTRVAKNLADLTDGTPLENPINVDEFGDPGSNGVWSGTQADGTAWEDALGSTSNCSNWTTASGSTSCNAGDPECAAQGNSAVTDAQWTLMGSQSSPFYSSCSAPHTLYCFGPQIDP